MRSGCIEGISPAHPELADYLGKMSNPEIWAQVELGSLPDPLTAAEAIVLNDIKEKMRITLVTGGIPPEVCQKMQMRHVWPADLNAYLRQRLEQNPDLKIGILRQSAEVLPILISEPARA